MKKKYYNLSKLLECGCNWNILYGMRANGKSYAVKEHALKQAFNKGVKFVYLRRWSEDIKTKDVDTYFDDIDVKKITGGKYNGVMAYQGFFYFSYIDEEAEKEARGPQIGRYCSLNQGERYKSQVFNDYDIIIFEEFLTNKIYLGSSDNPEPKQLMQFVSTVSRDRDIKVFMIGNTISRVCPYFSEWGLSGVMQQKPGTIDIYHLRGENGVVDIAVENCEVVETKSKMFFGNSSKQITSGEWEVNDCPKLLKPYAYYDMLYEIDIQYGDFKYIMQLMCDGETGGTFVYIYPNTSGRKINRVITNVFHVDPYITNGLNPRIRAEQMIARCFREGSVCYSDNLTGTDFKQILANYDLKGVKF